MAQLSRRTLRGSLTSLRSLGVSVTLLELLRRLLGVRYRVNGLVVNDSKVFRSLRKLALKGYRVYASSNYVYVNTGWGVSRAPLNGGVWAWLLAVLAEDLEGFYGCLDVDGNVVLDVGAFMGETACFFARRGARLVHAFEPVKRFYDVLLDNVRLNGLSGKVIPHNYGVWVSDGRIAVNVSGGGRASTLSVGRQRIHALRM